MLPKEAKWIGERVLKLPDEAFPALNVGCNTLEFRTISQPYIQDLIFGPLAKQNRTVIHADMQEDKGVDLVGNLMAEEYRNKIRSLEVKTVFCNNILEHVTDPMQLAKLVEEIVPSKGYIIVSGPLCFPIHPDPIDNGLRATAEEFQAYFPNSTLIEYTHTQQDYLFNHSTPLPQLKILLYKVAFLVSVLMPFYKSKYWVDRVKRTPFILKGYQATAAIFQKN